MPSPFWRQIGGCGSCFFDHAARHHLQKQAKFNNQMQISLGTWDGSSQFVHFTKLRWWTWRMACIQGVLLFVAELGWKLEYKGQKCCLRQQSRLWLEKRCRNRDIVVVKPNESTATSGCFNLLFLAYNECEYLLDCVIIISILTFAN